MLGSTYAVILLVVQAGNLHVHKESQTVISEDR